MTQGRNGRRAINMTDMTLEQLLDSLIDARMFRTHREIARECDMTDATLSQVLKGDPNKLRRLSVEHCLRLARKIQAHPAAVLRVAGQKDAALVVDDLWPRIRKQTVLSRRERELITQWREVSITGKHHLSAIIDIYAEQGRAKPGAARTAGTRSGRRKPSARRSPRRAGSAGRT